MLPRSGLSPPGDVWLGNLFVLGFGMAWHPWAASAMDLLPPAMKPADRDRLPGGHRRLFRLAVTGEQRRELGQNGWKVVRLPPADRWWRS